MKNIDNMGGFIAVSYILHQNLESFVSLGNKCRVSLIGSKEWKPLPIKRKGIELDIASSRPSGGQIYDIAGSILCKADDVIDELRLYEHILLKYQTADKVWHVAGTDDYPLTITVVPLTPTQANEFAGYRIDFVGQQLIEPPILIE